MLAGKVVATDIFSKYICWEWEFVCSSGLVGEGGKVTRTGEEKEGSPLPLSVS